MLEVERIAGYLFKCQKYDGCFGLRPNLESHGAATFLAVASLTFLKKQDKIPNKRKLIQ